MNIYLGGLYKEVQYIQSSGTQYIDTGIINKWDTLNVDIKFMMTSLESNVEKGVFGAKGGTSASNQAPTIFFSTSNHLSTWFGSGTIWNIISGATNTIYNVNNTFTTTNRYCTINGTSYSKTQSVANNANNQSGRMAIFADGSVPAAVNASMKLYYCKITVDGTLVRDFIPCYRVSDNVIGLFDKVGNKFYTNAGTGSFTKGSDVGTFQPELKNAYIGEVWTPGSNTLAYYPFSDNGNDYSGNGYNLTSNGTTTYTTVGGVKSANFSGSNYLSNSSLTTSTIGQTFTISFWGYSSSQLGITSMAKVSNSWQGWGVYLETGQLGRIRGEVQNNNTPTRLMLSITYQEGWHHIVFTHNSSNGMSISYDGEVKSTGTGAMTTNGGYLVVGAILDSTIYKFNGNVSEVILENKVWTASEISHYYNLTKSNYGL